MHLRVPVDMLYTEPKVFENPGLPAAASPSSAPARKDSGASDAVQMYTWIIRYLYPHVKYNMEVFFYKNCM